MKILLATDTYHPQVNGAAYFTQRLAHHLARRGHRVAVVAPSRSFSNTCETDDVGVTTYGIRSVPLPFYPNLRVSPSFLGRTAIGAAIRAAAPDVVHVQNHFLIGGYVAATARRLNVPVVGTNHFMPENIVAHLPLPQFMAPVIKGIMWRQFRTVYEKLDRVTAPSIAATAMLSTIGLRQRALTVSNGVDLSQFHPGTDGAYLREKYGLPDRPTLLFVGRLDDEKCLPDLLRAVPLILRTCEVHVVIAGIGPRRGAIEQLIHELGIAESVTLAGFVPGRGSATSLPHRRRICHARGRRAPKYCHHGGDGVRPAGAGSGRLGPTRTCTPWSEWIPVSAR